MSVSLLKRNTERELRLSEDIMLLKEVRVLTDLEVISESRSTGVMCIRGTFQRAEEENHNQRVYPKAVLESCVKNLSEKLSGRELVGELDHPADGVVKLQNASHLITKLEWQGNDLIGEAEILPTPAGQIAKSLINAGVKIGISSRGMGTLSESSKGAKIVNDDYKMITFDLVADPSTKGAYPSLAESKQHALDFVEKVIKPAISEQAFVARLKKKLDEAAKTKDNPWAICTAQVGRGDKAKYERCVKKVKGKIDEGCGPSHSKKKKLKAMKTNEELEATGPRPNQASMIGKARVKARNLQSNPTAGGEASRKRGLGDYKSIGAELRAKAQAARAENSSRTPLTLPSIMEFFQKGKDPRVKKVDLATVKDKKGKFQDPKAANKQREPW